MFHNPGTSPILFATSVLRGLRRTLETSTALKLYRLWKRSALRREGGKLASEPGQVSYDDTMKSLDCHVTPSWWLTPSRKS